MINEISELRDYYDWVSNAVNSCVGIIGVFLKGINTELLGWFLSFKNLSVVNGNLLDVTNWVAEFMWEICSLIKR